MGRIVKQEIQKDSGKLDLTPMIDCVFLLIIFFMIVSEMVDQELENLTLPKAISAKEDIGKEKRLVINITHSFRDDKVESHIIIKREKYNDQEKLTEYLKKRVTAAGKDETGEFSELRVKIRAANSAEFKKVQQAMVACVKAGIVKVSFGAEPRGNY